MSSQTIFVTKGSTDVSVDVHLIQDGGATTPGDPLTGLLFNSTGLVCYYREGATGTVTQLTLATQTVGGAHTDGGFVLLSDTLMPGSYRLDLSDTIVSGTNNQATVVLSGHADLAPHTINLVLTNVDLYDGVRGGMTALPNAAADAAGGLPISDTGGLDMDTIGSEVTTIDTKVSDIQGATFATGTDSLEAIRNRGDSAWTGSPPTSDSGTAQAGSSTTLTLEAGFPTDDNVLDGQLIHITAGTGAPASKAISSYNGTTGVATIVGTWPVTPDNTSVYDVFPDDIDEITAAPSAADVADAVWDENTTGHSGASTFGQRVSVDVPAILVDTAQIGPATGASIAADIADVKSDTAATLVDTGTTLPATLGTPAGASLAADVADVKADTAATLVDTATLGAPAGASHAADNAAIKAETAAILADTGTTLDTKMNNLQTTANDIETDTQDIQSRLPASLNNGVMPADIQRIRDIVLTGDGSGTPFDV